MNAIRTISALSIIVLSLTIASPALSARLGTDSGLAATASGEEARAEIGRLFALTDGSPEAIAEVAISLIRDLEGDPLAMADAANLIAAEASKAMGSLTVVRIAIAENFTLPEGAMGWDFGPSDAPLFPKFQRVSPGDFAADGDGPDGISQDGGDGLLTDGIIDARKFNTTVPAGAYRLIVLTGDPGGATGLARPLGNEIRVNGVAATIANAQPDQWTRRAYLTAHGVSTGSTDAPPANATTGAATVLAIDIGDRNLSLELGADGNPTLLSGLILEPASGPSVLDIPGPLPDSESLLRAEAMIAEAIGRVIEAIATAAGDDATRAQILELPAPPVQDAQTVSAS